MWPSVEEVEGTPHEIAEQGPQQNSASLALSLAQGREVTNLTLAFLGNHRPSWKSVVASKTQQAQAFYSKDTCFWYLLRSFGNKGPQSIEVLISQSLCDCRAKLS